MGTWVRVQRKFNKSGQLSKDRICRLEEIGFVWDLIEAAWEEMFAALVQYKKDHGDCNVPARWSENPKLGIWVGVQRRNKQANQLNPALVRRLEQIGFIWDARDAAWEEMFAALVAYKERYGHCNVLDRWSKDKKLGCWVGRQRIYKRTGRLSPDRVRRLETIDFKWGRR